MSTSRLLIWNIEWDSTSSKHRTASQAKDILHSRLDTAVSMSRDKAEVVVLLHAVIATEMRTRIQSWKASAHQMDSLSRINMTKAICRLTAALKLISALVLAIASCVLSWIIMEPPLQENNNKLGLPTKLHAIEHQGLIYSHFDKYFNYSVLWYSKAFMLCMY